MAQHAAKTLMVFGPAAYIQLARAVEMVFTVVHMAPTVITPLPTV